MIDNLNMKISSKLWLITILISVLVTIGFVYLRNKLNIKTRTVAKAVIHSDAPVGIVSFLLKSKEVYAEPISSQVSNQPEIKPEPAKPAPQTQNKPAVSVSGAKLYIYMKESGNRLTAVNKSSGACGLGQSLPCSKLANACPDWRTNYACQDRFFSSYAINRYGSWEQAKIFWDQSRWW